MECLGETVDIPELYDLTDCAIDEDALLTISGWKYYPFRARDTRYVPRYDEKHKKNDCRMQQQEREQTGIRPLKISQSCLDTLLLSKWTNQICQNSILVVMSKQRWRMRNVLLRQN